MLNQMQIITSTVKSEIKNLSKSYVVILCGGTLNVARNNTDRKYNKLYCLRENYLTNSDSVRFLGLTLDKNLSWKLHIDQLCSKLASACFILRTLSSLETQQNMMVVYFSYFQSVMTYGVIFWGNSTDRNKVFKLQKRAIRLITNSSNRTSCRRLFKELGILPVQSQYILSLALFVVKKHGNIYAKFRHTYKKYQK